MKKILSLVLFFSLIWTAQSFSQGGGADLFKLKCGICHTIGGGRLVGPDLANVKDRHSEDWLLTFIHSSQTMIKSGDADAVALFEENNKVIMPDPMISDAEIKSLLSYIAENSTGGTGAAAETVSVLTDAKPEDLSNGKNLFEGRVRFANGGPSCITCHNGLSHAFFSENSFSTKDLSNSFANLGEKGVKAILDNPPFPVMAKAFEGHSLKEHEVHDLLFFLQDAGAKNVNKAQMSSGYLLYGILGACALLVLYAGLWYERKNRSVNDSIYKRQIKSAN